MPRYVACGWLTAIGLFEHVGGQLRKRRIVRSRRRHRRLAVAAARYRYRGHDKERTEATDRKLRHPSMLCQESGLGKLLFLDRADAAFRDTLNRLHRERRQIARVNPPSRLGFRRRLQFRAPSRCHLMISMQGEVKVLTAADQPKGAGHVLRLVMRHRVGQNKYT